MVSAVERGSTVVKLGESLMYPLPLCACMHDVVVIPNGLPTRSLTNTLLKECMHACMSWLAAAVCCVAPCTETGATESAGDQNQVEEMRCAGSMWEVCWEEGDVLGGGRCAGRREVCWEYVGGGRFLHLCSPSQDHADSGGKVISVN